MAIQQSRPNALTIAPRLVKSPLFNGSDAAWRALCDTYPSAETPEVIIAALEYCSVRKLDPYKRPVHIVPMWNSKLRRRVQTIMQGINEVETTASRTNKWAGMDRPEWGKEVERTFRGPVEDDQGGRREETVTLRFPLSCAVTVYKLVDGKPRPFTEELYWEESYARAGSRTEVPNARWRQAPRQMLHKCFSADTEVLTEWGFYRFREVPVGCRILQVTTNGLDPVAATPFRQPYVGPMIQARSTGLNFCVTPDHDMILDNGDRIEAGEMFAQTRMRPRFRLPLHAPVSTRPDLSISDDGIRLAAWYLTDGTDRPGGSFVVSVSRSRKIAALSAISAPARRRQRRCAGDVAMLGEQAIITRSNRQEFTYRLAECGGLVKAGKQVEFSRLLALSFRQARLFVETMLAGDGAISANGTRRYHASHDRILRAFETACVLAGWSVSQRTPRRAPTGQIGYVVSVGRRASSPVKLLPPSAPQADRAGTDEGWFAGLEMVSNPSGEVWCVTVPSGAIIVRRDGQSMVCGNCTKAAVLRAAFPEEGFGYTAEEMEDKDVEAGGVVIDGKAETAAAPQREQLEQREDDAAYEAEPAPAESAQAPTDESDELRRLLDEVATMDLERISELGADHDWISRVHDLFPPEADKVRDAVRARKQTLLRGRA
jgi:phage recombination protein Bet